MMDKKVIIDCKTFSHDSDTEEMELELNELPVSQARHGLMIFFNAHDTLIVIGETASGKTTQIPQYIYEAGAHRNKLIAITQPRRVAAISIATRVAQERKVEVGGLVGYSVRFDEKTSDATKIKYMTDGMLLREAINDPLMRRYSVVIIDEVHERTLNTDVLLGILKEAQIKRNMSPNTKKHLKIIVMSATIDADNFLNYFENSKAVYIEGRQHKLNIFSPVTGYDEVCFTTISMIINFHEKFDISYNFLAFMTGYDEIMTVVNHLKRMQIPNMEVCPLYSALSQEEQLHAISKPKEGVRRVIISTNIAETSLTIPGVRVVIDSGLVKTKVHLHMLSIDSLQVVKISKAQAMQRAGRAAREGPGTCYRLYTRDAFSSMADFTVPEVLRSNLAGVVLHMLNIGITSPSSFDWLDKPLEEALYQATEELKQLGAIVRNLEPIELTELGKLMAASPLEPRLAKLLLLAPKYKLLEPVCSILGVLSSESIYLTCRGNVEKARVIFYAPESDLITYLNILRAFRKSKRKVAFCKQYKFNYRSLAFAIKVRKQILDYTRRVFTPLDLKANRIGKEFESEAIRKFFHRCLAPNLAYNEGPNHYKTRSFGKEVVETAIHPSSCIKNSKAPVLHFVELTQLSEGKFYMNHVSYIEPSWLAYPQNQEPSD